MDNLQSALAFAAKAHANQRDKSGEPYIGHVGRVVGYARDLLDGIPADLLDEGERTEILIAAALHDVAEDHEETGVTHADLMRAGVPGGALRRIRRLDKAFKVGTYHENIEAMAMEGDIGVVIVKLADNIDNSDPVRIAALPPEGRSIANRYARSRAVLQATYDAFRSRTVASEPSLGANPPGALG